MSSVRSGLVRMVERAFDGVADLFGAVVFMLVFFLILTPAAIAMRALGKDPLRLARDPAAVSYWQSRGTRLRSIDLKTQR